LDIVDSPYEALHGGEQVYHHNSHSKGVTPFVHIPKEGVDRENAKGTQEDTNSG
jgi:hypothetical protein